MSGQNAERPRLNDLLERELGFLRSMISNGRAVAVPAALQFCHEHHFPVPDWLLPAAIELLSDLLKSERPSRRGRTASHVARYRQDSIDFTRWSTVLWQREAASVSALTGYGSDVQRSSNEETHVPDRQTASGPSQASYVAQAPPRATLERQVKDVGSQ